MYKRQALSSHQVHPADAWLDLPESMLLSEMRRTMNTRSPVASKLRDLAQAEADQELFWPVASRFTKLCHSSMSLVRAETSGF